jgi:hypothetical protein
MFDTDHIAVRFAFIVAIGVMVGAVFSTWHEARVGGPVVRVAIGTDFATFHGAAALTVDGEGDGIYTPVVLGAKLAETTGYEAITSQSYGHPPFFVLFFVPLALLPFPIAYVLFALAGTAVLGAAIARLGGLRPAQAIGIALMSVPGFATLQLGQMGLWVGALLVAVYLALRRGRIFVAGLLLGLLAFKSLYAIGIGVWWLLRGRHYIKGVVGAACSAVVLIAAGFLIPGGWSGYLAVLDGSGDEFLTGVAKSGFSMAEMWITLLPDSTIAVVLWVATAIAIVVVFRRVVGHLDHQLEVSFALAIIVGLLISPRVGWYDWVILVVPAALLWVGNPEQRDRLVLAGAWLFPAAALSWPLARGIENVSGVYLQLAPWFLAGVAWWWFRDSIRAPDHPGHSSNSHATVP